MRGSWRGWYLASLSRDEPGAGSRACSFRALNALERIVTSTGKKQRKLLRLGETENAIDARYGVVNSHPNDRVCFLNYHPGVFDRFIRRTSNSLKAVISGDSSGLSDSHMGLRGSTRTGLNDGSVAASD